MNWLGKEAKKRGLSEVWLGAEADAVSANAFYSSLKPDEVTPLDYLRLLYVTVIKRKESCASSAEIKLTARKPCGPYGYVLMPGSFRDIQKDIPYTNEEALHKGYI